VVKPTDTARPQQQTASAGFTLIELVITVSILLLLVAATVFGANAFLARSDEQRSQADLDMVHTTQVAFATSFGRFTPWPADLTDANDIPDADGALTLPDSGLLVTPLPAVDAGDISLAVGTAGSLALATLTPDDVCITLLVPSPDASGTPEEGTLTLPQACDARAVLPAGEAPEDPATVR
jgi:prepilin-type N-terminal cleavage/methylation domain-containing protein